jgi:hypothetical protein
MPRYFFHIQDGTYHPDEDGTELPGPAEARVEAMATAAAIMKDIGERLWNGEQWQMHVVSTDGAPVCDLEFRAALTAY